MCVINKWQLHTLHCCLLGTGFWECRWTVLRRTFCTYNSVIMEYCICFCWSNPWCNLFSFVFYHGAQLVLPCLFSITMWSHLLTCFIFQNGTLKSQLYARSYHLWKINSRATMKYETSINFKQNSKVVSISWVIIHPTFKF